MISPQISSLLQLSGANVWWRGDGSLTRAAWRRGGASPSRSSLHVLMSSRLRASVKQRDSSSCFISSTRLLFVLLVLWLCCLFIPRLIKTVCRPHPLLSVRRSITLEWSLTLSSPALLQQLFLLLFEREAAFNTIKSEQDSDRCFTPQTRLHTKHQLQTQQNCLNHQTTPPYTDLTCKNEISVTSQAKVHYFRAFTSKNELF